MKKCFVLLVAAAMLAGYSAFASDSLDATKAIRSQSAWFRTGEAYTYEMIYSTIGIEFKVASGTLTVKKESYDGKEGYLSIVQGQPGKFFAKLFPLSYESRLYLNHEKKPVHFYRDFKEGKVNGFEQFDYDWQHRKIHVQSLTKNSGAQDYISDMRAWTMDFNSIYLVLRNFDENELVEGMEISPVVLLSGEEIGCTISYKGRNPDNSDFVFSIVIKNGKGIYLRNGIPTEFIISSEPDHHLVSMELPVPLGRVRFRLLSQ